MIRILKIACLGLSFFPIDEDDINSLSHIILGPIISCQIAFPITFLAIDHGDSLFLCPTSQTT